MCFFISFVPATFWFVVGYFVLFSSTRTDGWVGTLGRVLATWIFLLSAAIVIAGAYVTLNDLCPFGAMMMSAS